MISTAAAIFVFILQSQSRTPELAVGIALFGTPLPSPQSQGLMIVQGGISSWEGLASLRQLARPVLPAPESGLDSTACTDRQMNGLGRGGEYCQGPVPYQEGVCLDAEEPGAVPLVGTCLMLSPMIYDADAGWGYHRSTRKVSSTCQHLLTPQPGALPSIVVTSV
ncbi:hypothetical protein MAPG_07791 [Magnaporthiopsis poae ATCC 64411]|uniref:Uncharacterized protein n=1 Tax=Magnaporthiopsis poae (strain ATCC 64411 / 73-15) TaxID=644358 RepID=A0A0C4E5L9_MAGP6|nr:hypothetical protein MAPG_07791 [Magnaporthiopsis poae ATCC 64411]